ncbi:MAG: glycosyltransferase family 4 protein [Saprospiraceae bacterium]|nr:glycosyltransferase family 4 protein [Saprospiraceae bacterium]
MQVLHLFDRYLNSTMNWAFQLLQHCPDIEHLIAAPIFVENEFLRGAFEFWPSPYQQTLPKNEWEISGVQQSMARLGMRSGHFHRQLIRKIRRKPPQLLHAHFASMGWQALGPAQKTGLPLVVSFYGYDYEQLPFRKPVYKKRYRQLFEKATAFVVEGPHGAGILQGMGCPDEKIHIIPLGVDVQKISFWPRKKASGQLKMLQAATFTQKKGHLYAIQAVEKALKDCPGLHLTLLGEAQDKGLHQELKEYVRRHKLSANIVFEDFVPTAKFQEFLLQFDLFIHPSCYAEDHDCEGGAPIVLLDAQASGLPVISTTHCDIPAEVIHLKTGWLAEEKDVEELAAGIRNFFQMPAGEFEAYSRAARAHVVEHFDIETSGRNLRNLYTQILRS